MHVMAHFATRRLFEVAPEERGSLVTLVKIKASLAALAEFSLN